MDSIKEAMIREDDTGETNPSLEHWRNLTNNNPDDWARFMCRYVDARATCPNGIRYLSYEIVAALDAAVTMREQTMKPTEIAAKLVGAWENEFNMMSATENTDVALGELTRRIATALVGEPRADAEPSDVEGPNGCSTRVGRTAGLIPATGANPRGVPTLPTRLRVEAMRARDEHGNTDFYALLREAAHEFERLLDYAQSETLRAEDAQAEVKRWRLSNQGSKPAK